MTQRSKFSDTSLMTFGGHLEVLRQMLFRIIFIVILTSIFVFCSKDITFEIMLAPSDSNFITYRTIERLVSQFNINFHFEDFSIDLITTEISSQFMTHFLTSVYLGTLLASPYILFELGYCSTCHLAQGSQYPNIVIYVDTTPSTSDYFCKWLYTAITRARFGLTLVM